MNRCVKDEAHRRDSLTLGERNGFGLRWVRTKLNPSRRRSRFVVSTFMRNKSILTPRDEEIQPLFAKLKALEIIVIRLGIKISKVLLAIAIGSMKLILKAAKLEVVRGAPGLSPDMATLNYLC